VGAAVLALVGAAVLALVQAAVLALVRAAVLAAAVECVVALVASRSRRLAWYTMLVAAMTARHRFSVYSLSHTVNNNSLLLSEKCVALWRCILMHGVDLNNSHFWEN
jgi:hypothetical protein